jgi:RNA polymerase sigma factor (sigma-70 family)
MGNVTSLIVKAVIEGDPDARDHLYRLTEPELRKFALHWIRRYAAKGRVRTTEVIVDTFMKLMKIDSADWQHRGQFYCFACHNTMCVVIDMLRKGDRFPTQPIPEETSEPIGGLSRCSLLTLQAALKDLERDLSARHRQIVELRFIGEFTLDEIAELFSTAEEVVNRDCVFRMSKVALAYLREKLQPCFPDLGRRSNSEKGKDNVFIDLASGG